MSPEEYRGAELARVLEAMHAQRRELEAQNEALRVAQLELQAARDRYAELFARAPVGYLVLDGDRVVRANLASVRLFGGMPLEGRRVGDFLSAGDAAEFARCRQMALDEGGSFTCEVSWRDRDGSTASLRLDSTALASASGALHLCLTAIVDQTECKRAAELLREQESRMRSVLQSAADGIITTNALGVVEAFNEACEEIFGHAAADVLGRNVAMLLANGEGAEYFRDRGRATAARSGRRHPHELLGLRSDGAVFPLELSVARLEDGEPRFTGVVRDLTERKRFERRLRHAQKLEAIGRLASGVAHDFNNLLMGIAGCAGIAASKAGAESSVADHLHEIKQAALAGGSIAAQLLAFGSDRSEGTEVVELDEAVRAITGMLRRLVGEDVELTVSLEASQARCTMQPGEVDQILMNLVANARDAMPDGGRVDVATWIEPAESAASRGLSGPCVVLRVSDDGAGMDEQVAEYALEPFFTTKQVGDGVGLGLSTVYGIVRRAGGEMEIVSAPGEGTTVELWLLCECAETVAPEPDPQEPVRRGDGTVLVVEDEPLVLLTVRHYLEGAGFRVLSARSGPEAVECCTRFPGTIDVLLTDMVLPGMSGEALAARARALKPGLRTMYMSAHARHTLVTAGRLDADADVLQKPFTADELLARMDEVLAPAPGAVTRPSGSPERPR